MITDFSPFWISIKTSLLSTFITFIIGVPIAYIIAKTDNKFKGFIDGIITLPLILPPTVVGFFLLILCGKTVLLASFSETSLM